MITKAPRAFNREMYVHRPENVFYGTDDGFQDGSFGEFAKIRAHYENVDPQRREDIHMISVVGGLYGLNLIPLWKPKAITIFDINPTAITYFKIIHRVFTTSRDVGHFLARLTAGDYEAETEEEQFVRENICLKQKGALPRSRGSSKRSYEESWKIAFEHFDLTKQILTEAPLNIRTEAMESESFRTWIARQNNLWIYGSNISEFHYFDLDFDDPTNVVVLQIIFPGQAQVLDLAPLSGSGPVRVKCEIPIRAVRRDEDIAPEPQPQENGVPEMLNKTRIATNAAPPATGTYSQAVRTGDLVFVTGQTGRDPENGKLEEGLSAQTHRMLANIDATLNAAGCRREDIVKVTLLLADIKDFKAVDQIYAAWLPGRGVTALPARTAFQAAALPAGALVMLEVVAACPVE